LGFGTPNLLRPLIPPKGFGTPNFTDTADNTEKSWNTEFLPIPLIPPNEFGTPNFTDTADNAEKSWNTEFTDTADTTEKMAEFRWCRRYQ